MSYMDETGYVYDGKPSNMHPSYKPLSGKQVDETGSAYSDLGVKVPSGLNVSGSYFDPTSASSALYGGSSGSGGTAAAKKGNGTPFKRDKNGNLVFKNRSMELAMEYQRQEQNRINAWNAEQAQKQMDFQKMMSDTAHQREVADLQAAGLNPVLSATGGAGASTTSGAAASASDQSVQTVADIAMAAIQGMASTAVGVSGFAGLNNRNQSIWNNKYFSKFASAAAGAAGYQVAHALLGLVL